MPTTGTDGTSWCLLVDTYGAFIGKHSERLRISVKGEVQAERPLLGLEHVLVLGGGVSLSADAVRACAERGIPISFLSSRGQPYATLLAPDLVGTVQTRRQQLLAYLDERGVWLAKAFARGKLLNQANLLKYMAKYRRERDRAGYEVAREAAFELEELARRIEELAGGQVEEIRERALGLEGQGATRYWPAVRRLVSPELGWAGRETRGAQDLVNMALNYGYGVLYGQVERAVVLAGLDPYAGFLHEDTADLPSEVLDLAPTDLRHRIRRSDPPDALPTERIHDAEECGQARFPPATTSGEDAKPRFMFGHGALTGVEQVDRQDNLSRGRRHRHSPTGSRPDHHRLPSPRAVPSASGRLRPVRL
jgi:CRISPR-associated protein Cas1